jgi:hypothetical protein
VVGAEWKRRRVFLMRKINQSTLIGPDDMSRKLDRRGREEEPRRENLRQGARGVPAIFFCDRLLGISKVDDQMDRWIDG